MPSHRMRPLVFGLATLALAVAAVIGLTANIVVRDALAQTEETAPGGAIQTPPSVPGVEDPNPAAGTLPLDPSLAPATPVAPVDAKGTTGLVETGDGLTTSLGGSDVAVSSEGGSYEVDGPRRKGKRFPAPTPRP